MTSHWISPRRVAARTLPASLWTSRDFASLDRFFDEMWHGFPVAGRTTGAAFDPRVGVETTDDAMRLTADLPGLDEKDFEVSIDADVLTIKGEKKRELEQDRHAVGLIERSHGRFERRFRLAWEVDPDKVEASYRNGVLEVVIPKPQVRTIPVETS